MYRAFFSLLVNGQQSPLTVTAELNGSFGRIPLEKTGSGPGYILFSSSPAQAGWRKKYSLRFHISGLAGLPDFEVRTDLWNGHVLRDPFEERFIPSPVDYPIFTVQVAFAYAEGFVSQCAIALDCPDDNAVYIHDAKVWLGAQQLVIGPAPDVPLSLSWHYRGGLKPGSYALRVEHPRYKLATDEPPVLLNGTAVAKRIRLVRIVTPPETPPGNPPELPPTTPAPITDFQIVGGKLMADINEVVEFHVIPPEVESKIAWHAENPQVLEHQGTFGQFKAIAHGLASITARLKGTDAMHSVSVAVRQTPGGIVLRPLDRLRVVEDPHRGLILRGEILLQFVPGTPETGKEGLFRQYELRRIGFIPGSEIHQLEFRGDKWTLNDLMSKLDEDPRIRFSSPNAVLTYTAGIPPVRPPEVPSANWLNYWHFHKTEAYEAFGILKELGIQQRYHSIVNVDSGLWLGPGWEVHKDLKGHFDEGQSFLMGFFGATTGVRAVQDPGEQDEEGGPVLRYHGTMTSGIALAIWNNGAAAGVDPRAWLIMAKPSIDWALTPLSNMAATFQRIGDNLISEGTRVVTCQLSGKRSAESINKTCADGIKSIISHDGLVLIAAGNKEKSVNTEGLASIKAMLTKEERDNVLIICGTQVPIGKGDAEILGPETRLRLLPGEPAAMAQSNYAPMTDTWLVDLAAPGRYIYTCESNHATNPANGTSFATPQVSGTAALLFSIAPQWTKASRIKEILLKSSDSIFVAKPGTDAALLPRISTEPDKYIGVGRLNVWQALLSTLNAFSGDGGIRYAGLRVTADRDDMEISLVYSDSTAEPIKNYCNQTSKAFKHRWNGTQTSTVTLTNKSKPFPTLIRGKVFENNQWISKFEQKVWLSSEYIDSLEYQPVLTRILFTQGGVHLQQERAPLPPNRVKVSITNRGTSPADPEMLKPQPFRPKNKGYRKWMTLDDGDSYAIKYTVSGYQHPNELVVTILDMYEQPLPPNPLNQEEKTWVTVPFTKPDNKRDIYVDCKFPSNAQGMMANIELEVYSLNNELVRDKIVVRVSSPDQSGVKINAPGWWFREYVDYTAQPKKATALCTPPSWKSQTKIDFPFDVPYWEVTFSFASPPSALPGDTGVCKGTVEFYGSPQTTYDFKAKLVLPDLELILRTPDEPRVERVPGKQAVRARFDFLLNNRSPFTVKITKLKARDDLFPIHAPPPDVPREEFRFRPDDNPASVVNLGPGQAVFGAVWVYYHSNVLDMPEGTIGTRQLHFLCEDVWGAMLGGDTAYPSSDIFLKSILAGPGG